MHQSRTEEKAALLLTEADEEEYEMNNCSLNPEPTKVSIVPKRAKSCRRDRDESSTPIICFALILGAFILGCISGVVIILYRMSQDAPSPNSVSYTFSTKADLTIQKKLLESIQKERFIKMNRSDEVEQIAANGIYADWKTFPSEFIRINRNSYDLDVSHLQSSDQFNGLELFDGKTDKILIKLTALKTDMIFLTSLIKSDTITSSSIYYVNYGREEDFAHLLTHSSSLLETNNLLFLMKHNPSLISVTEQIQQAIRYHAAALILFDDNEKDQTLTTDERLSFYEKWRKLPTNEEKVRFLDGIPNEQHRQIPVLSLSFDDVQKLFETFQSDANQWASFPTQWNKKPTSLKLGGSLSTMKLRISTNFRQDNIQLPVLTAFLRGSNDPDHFILVGFQIKSSKQNRIINEIIRSYTNQMKNGWTPKRSIVFCGWSGVEYDHYTVRRWLSENHALVDRYLLAYLDLGNDIIGNGTLNLHGSPLLEQIVHHGADLVPSPLKHDHSCHRRQSITVAPSHDHEDNYHDHGRRRRRDGDHQHSMSGSEPEPECEPHKLLDEWIKATRNQTESGHVPNMIQMIDPDSSAALFQLKYGIPSLLIEMTMQEVITKEKFYVARPSVNQDFNVEPEVYVSYTQFICEILRQLSDEPLIPFNLTSYAEQIDRNVVEYLKRFEEPYMHLSSHLGDSSEFNQTISSLTGAIRKIQMQIDQMVPNDWTNLIVLNKKLFEFERLFIINKSSKSLDLNEEKSRHILVGPAIGLSKCSVPFPALSNILYEIPSDPPSEICDATKLIWIQCKKHIEQVRRTLSGIESLLINSK